MEQYLRSLNEQIDSLIGALDAAEAANAEAIARTHPTNRVGAKNLVRYSELRRHDIRALQADLSSIGATRLTTAEPDVKARLQAAHNVVSAYLGEELSYTGPEMLNAFSTADDILESNANALLGDVPEGRSSRIMVTLPTEAADSPELVVAFAEAGMDVARINGAHDGPAAWTRMIEHVHQAEQKVGRRIRIALDLAGPKLRTGAIADGPAVARARVSRTETGELITPAKLWLIPAGAVADGAEWPQAPETGGRPTLPVLVDDAWLDGVEEGSRITLVDTRDAKRDFAVTEIHDVDGVRCAFATGSQNAYVSNNTLLQHEWTRTRASGIPKTEQHLLVSAGDTLWLTTDPTPVDPSTQPEGEHLIGCSLPEAVRAIEVGQRVMFDDGTIEAVAVETVTDGDETRVRLDVTFAKPGGTKLRAYKGINLPDTDLPLPSLTEEDLEAFEFIARHGDMANVSFIRNASDVADVLAALENIAQTVERDSGAEAAERVRRLGIVLKIETIPAYEHLADVLLEGMRHENLGIMIARGDLAVEFGFYRLAEVPRLIANMAEAAHVPTVMATQVLENLAKTGLPSRAEITDVAYALRAEAVMLNKGPHITDAITTLTTIGDKLGASQRKNRIQLRRINSWQ
ncbi:pyruvate kinase [Corynebacterium uterequi]|uniref:pyruvate kinase n=1 Tax=Corynebacterium uterequi TaxID=1072256 RepID=A0A0G3HLU6_9CORY|nr:pyruvate kinase [Corynebacterium uterequi]AKK12102.1 pyruvate kinase [Corynebacterium uterequi]